MDDESDYEDSDSSSGLDADLKVINFDVSSEINLRRPVKTSAARRGEKTPKDQAVTPFSGQLMDEG